MSAYNYFVPLILNVLITFLIGGYWYSLKGFGRVWIRSTFGSEGQFEYTFKNKSVAPAMLITLLCNILQNLFLLYLVSYIYMPSDFMAVGKLASTVVLLHVLYELPHIGFENRSYIGFLIHLVYHMVIATVAISNYYFFLKH